MPYTDYKTGGRDCRLFVTALGVLDTLPGTAAEFVELKVVKSVEITAPSEEAEAGDRSGGGFKGYALGDADFRMSAEINCVVTDAGYELLRTAKRNKTPVGVLSSVGNPNAIGVRLDYFEAYVIDLPANQGQNEIVSGTTEFIRAAGTIVPVYAHKTVAANEVWSGA